MLTNKELKEKGRRSVKKHYLLFLILCVIAVLFGNEFSANDGILKAGDLITGQQAEQNVGDGGEMSSSPRLGLDAISPVHVIESILNNDLFTGKKLAEFLREKFKLTGTDIVGHSKGVLAYLINTVTSGTLAIKLFTALNGILGSKEAAKVVFILIGFVLYSFFGVAVPEIYAVVLRRFFLEGRTYDKVPLSHGFHLLKVRRCVRATLAVVVKDVFLFLWALTIVGYFIKRYSYFMVPFIVAENPDIRPMEAIKLSRRMMDGHKMEAFKFELSFLHWIILGILTLGVTNVFYYLPYKIASTSEYYACVRQMAKDAGIEGAEMMDDDVLLTRADQALLDRTYDDVAEEEEYLEEHQIILTGYRKFFAEKLAIWLGRSDDKLVYQEMENRKHRIAEARLALAGEAYPVRLDPRVNENNRKVSHQINFLRCYTIWNLMAMFLIFCFIGWVWEVIVFMFQTGTFVNRGSLHGPWLPLYGTGGILIIILLSSLRKHPVALFFSTVVLCGVLEYVVSVVMEMMTGMRWWNYTGYFLNLDGRICAEGLIAFGVLGMLGMYIIAPALDAFLMKINSRVLVPLTIMVMAIFLGDVVYSQIHPHTGPGITDMKGSKSSFELPDRGGGSCG